VKNVDIKTLGKWRDNTQSLKNISVYNVKYDLVKPQKLTHVHKFEKYLNREDFFKKQEVYSIDEKMIKKFRKIQKKKPKLVRKKSVIYKRLIIPDFSR